MNRWRLVLDPRSGADARKEAWRALKERVRPPVLFQMRRRVDGWRHTEDLADLVLEDVYEQHAGGGGGASLRACVEERIDAVLRDEGARPGVDAEFERDWASSLFHAALKEFGRAHPEGHQLLLRMYDRPEGARPLRPAEVANRLQLPEEEVEDVVEDGRDELRRLFEDEIRHTTPDGASEEIERLLPRAAALLH